ncbi:MAG TPA: hypothetical protein DD733_02355 [Clostridiales bacterium]|nr:hypothetical protein [Eubacteriales bacterium]HBR30904.1 hypothetical protein [Clostridiales bacterium]
MIKPNYTVKSLVPYPSAPKDFYADDGLLKKADSIIFEFYKSRRRTYRFLFFSFCVFSVLGIYFYSYTSEGRIPVSLYTPGAEISDISFYSILSFREIHIIASVFLFLSGFSVFGPPVSLLFIACDAFVIGFTIRYSLSFLQSGYHFIFILLYFFCIALYAVMDILICCEVIRYSRYARGGTREMLRKKRFTGYLVWFLLISILDLLVSYMFIIT